MLKDRRTHELLTVKQTAERLNVSPGCVYALVRGKKLQHSRIGAGRRTIRVSENDLGAYLNSRTVVRRDEPVTAPRVKLEHISLRRRRKRA